MRICIEQMFEAVGQKVFQVTNYTRLDSVFFEIFGWIPEFNGPVGYDSYWVAVFLRQPFVKFADIGFVPLLGWLNC
ncbi:MAG: hypothetical protein KDB22_29095 [Planctomycetales bacterium]|nr:hypothetical protein [Planctomycetales bacterium]